MSISRSFQCLLAVLIAASPVAAAAQNSAPPSLTGRWRYDPSHSGQVAGERGDRNHGGIPGGDGFGGPGGRGGGEFGGREVDRKALAALLRAPQQLAIEQTEATFAIGIDLAPPLLLRIGGKATVDTLIDLSVRTSQAKWKGDRLEVERKIKGAQGKVIERYSIDQEHGGDLIVEIKVDGLLRVSEYRRVYKAISPAG